MDKAALEEWYKKAYELMTKLNKEGTMPKNGKELIKFLKEIGYKEQKEKGKGDHYSFELQEKEKLLTFLQREKVNLDGMNIDKLPILKRVSGVDAGTKAFGTVKGTLDRLFGLADLGQKPGSK